MKTLNYRVIDRGHKAAEGYIEADTWDAVVEQFKEDTSVLIPGRHWVCIKPEDFFSIPDKFQGVFIL